MGWSIGYDGKWKRDIGYGVPAYCDHPGCTEEINRGLSYVCGSDVKGGSHGCGLYFCANHREYVDLMDEPDREGAELCACCREGKPPFPLSAEHPDWMEWKLSDESWSDWRSENRDLVLKYKELTKKDIRKERSTVPGRSTANGTCLKCRQGVHVFGCRWCADCYYPGIDEVYNNYRSMLEEGFRDVDAAVRSGWKGAEEL